MAPAGSIVAPPRGQTFRSHSQKNSAIAGQTVWQDATRCSFRGWVARLSLALGIGVVARSFQAMEWKKGAAMRVFTTLPQEDLRKVGPAAQAIEAEGYDGVASTENKHDP